MGGAATVVCVKRVEHGMPTEEWDDSMPLPGDIVKAVAPAPAHANDEEFPVYSKAKNRSELSHILSKLNRRSDSVWVKVQRGNSVLDLRARVTAYRGHKLYRRFTVMAAGDNRHVAVLGDLTPDRCIELQGEMSRSVVNMDTSQFHKTKHISYDWKKKVATYLPDRNCTLISSILFKPFPSERSVEPTTRRSMAWFSAAVSSGAPLVFVNIQTEQIISRRETTKSSKAATTKLLQGIRLWFLPGIVEVPILLAPEEGETRFGLDIKRTEEGFICISSVAKGSAADRAGLLDLWIEANKAGHLVVISRLEGKGIMPSEASSEGLIQCCHQGSIKERLAAAMAELQEIRLHIMAWPKERPGRAPDAKLDGPAILLPPANDGPVRPISPSGNEMQRLCSSLDSGAHDRAYPFDAV